MPPPRRCSTGSSPPPRATSAVESAKLAFEGLGGFLAPLLVELAGIRLALVVAAIPLPLVLLTGRETLRRTDSAAAERSRLLRLLHTVPCFRPLDMVSLESVAAQVVPVTTEEGKDVVRQGERGDRFYVVDAGEADVLVDGFPVSTLGPGQSFGERALLRQVARTATVRARTPMELLSPEREAFLVALTGQAEAWSAAAPATKLTAAGSISRRERVALLSRVSMLSHLDARALEELAARSVVERWPAGATIIRRGDEGDRFYVLASGRAEVHTGEGSAVVLEPGDHFGDIAVLHRVRRTADVVATEDAVTLGVDGDDLLPAVRTRLLEG